MSAKDDRVGFAYASRATSTYQLAVRKDGHKPLSSTTKVSISKMPQAAR
jgi:hypothetical protein